MRLRRSLLATCTIALVAGMLAATLVSGGPVSADSSASGTTSTGQTLDISILSPMDGSVVGSPPGSLTVSGTAAIGPLTESGNVLYIVDVSGSTQSPQGQDCNGDGVVDAGDDFNGSNGFADTLDCEIAGVLALNESLAGSPGAEGGLILFAAQVAIADVGPAAGQQDFTSPLDADANGNGTADLEEVARSLRAGGDVDLFFPKHVNSFATRYDLALTQMNAAFVSKAGETNIAYFLSDGVPTEFTTGAGSPIQQAADAGTIVHTFTVGPVGDGCVPSEAIFKVADITGGTCTEVTNPADLAGSIVSAGAIDRVEVSLDGGAPVLATLDGAGNWSADLTGIASGIQHAIEATVFATDGTEVSADIVVTGNSAPDAGAGGPYTVDEGSSVSLDAGGSADSDSDALTYEWDFDADGVFDDATGEIPIFEAAGLDGSDSHNVALRACDEHGLCDEDTATVEIVNVAPTVDAGADDDIILSETFTSSGSFSDPGPDTYTATVDYGDGSGVQPLSLNLDDTFALSHAYSAAGVYTVEVFVTDDDLGSGCDALIVTVINVAPVLDPIGNQTVDEGAMLDVSLSASDDNGDPLSFSAGGLPAFANLTDHGDGKATLALAPGFDDAGGYPVTIGVSDGDLTDSETFTLTVNNVSRPPVADAGTDQSVNEGATVTLDASGSSDLDGDGLSYDWQLVSATGPGVSLSATDSANPTFTTTDDGVYTFELTVDDGQGGSATDQVVVTVLNVAPVVTLDGGASVSVGATVILTGSFSDPGADVWTATVDPGDGSGPHPVSLNPGGTFSAAYPALSGGTFTATVCVMDDDGGQGCASASVVVNPYAIFAGNDACGDGISLSGSGASINGALHSNSDLKVTGSKHAVDGAATYRCDSTVNGGQHSFSEGPTAISYLRPWPSQLVATDFACDISEPGTLDLSDDGGWWVGGTASSKQLAPLTICAGEITLKGSKISGNVTLVAGEIQISGSNLQLTAHQHGVLVFATGAGNDAIKVSGSGHQLSGELAARAGQVSLSGSGNSLTGSVIGWTVKISGSKWAIGLA